MKKNKLFIFVFVFIMLFGINMDGVLAKQDAGGAGTSSSYSYGIICSYYGTRKTVVTGSGTTGGITNGQEFPYIYTLKVKCANSDCTKLSATDYGLIKDLDGAKQELNVSNSDDITSIVNDKKSDFTFKSGEGVKNCPRTLKFSSGNVKLDFSDLLDIGDVSIDSYGISINSYERFSASSEKNIDIKKVTSDLLENKKRKSYSSGANGDTSKTTTEENSRQHGKNEDLIPYIMNALDDLGNEDYGISNDGTITCSALLGPKNIELIHDILLFMCILGIIMVVVFGIMEFIKAISSSDDDALAKAFKRLKVRIISIIILLILPVFVNLLLGLINDNVHFKIVNGEGTVTEDVSIQIGKASDCE